MITLISGIAASVCTALTSTTTLAAIGGTVVGAAASGIGAFCAAGSAAAGASAVGTTVAAVASLGAGAAVTYALIKK